MRAEESSLAAGVLEAERRRMEVAAIKQLQVGSGSGSGKRSCWRTASVEGGMDADELEMGRS